MPAQHTFSDISVDFGRHQASRADGARSTPIEFKMLNVHREPRDRVLTHDEIIEHLRRETFLTDRVLYTP
jgi:DNA-binding response OmpR family regulator